MTDLELHDQDVGHRRFPIDPILADSSRRMNTLLANKRHMCKAEWLQMLGEWWSACDDVGHHAQRLRRILRPLDRNELDLLMTTDECMALARLPEVITVYRGCYAHNRDGLSWTLDRSVAEALPYMLRYQHRDAKVIPYLLSGKVKRDRVIYKMDRNESEIVATDVVVYSVESLAPRGMLLPACTSERLA